MKPVLISDLLCDGGYKVFGQKDMEVKEIVFKIYWAKLVYELNWIDIKSYQINFLILQDTEDRKTRMTWKTLRGKKSKNMTIMNIQLIPKSDIYTESSPYVCGKWERSLYMELSR